MMPRLKQFHKNIFHIYSYSIIKTSDRGESIKCNVFIKLINE